VSGVARPLLTILRLFVVGGDVGSVYVAEDSWWCRVLGDEALYEKPMRGEKSDSKTKIHKTSKVRHGGKKDRPQNI
jgi:hypothetical protein